MKLYVHLIYLLGLLCFWEMILQPEGIRHEVVALNNDILNGIHLPQIIAFSTKLNETFQKMRNDYPGVQIVDYAGRSEIAFDCFESDVQGLSHLKKKDFWKYRTDYHETIKTMTDNDPRAASDDLLFIDKKDIVLAGVVLDYELEAVKKDMPVRLALALLRAQNYCATRFNYCGSFTTDPVSPQIIPNYVCGFIDQKISFGVISSRFFPTRLLMASPFLRPFKDGISTHDTIFEKTGYTEFPVKFWYCRMDEKSLKQGVDTVRFEVFSK